MLSGNAGVNVVGVTKQAEQFKCSHNLLRRPWSLRTVHKINANGNGITTYTVVSYFDLPA